METTKPDSIAAHFLIAANSWGDKKFKLKNRFAQLTDEDLFFREGGELELSQRLRSRLNKTAAEIDALIAGL